MGDDRATLSTSTSHAKTAKRKEEKKFIERVAPTVAHEYLKNCSDGQNEITDVLSRHVYLSYSTITSSAYGTEWHVI